MPQANRSHHFVVTGFLLIKAGEEENISQLTLNSMIRVDTKEITMPVLGKAQQALQMTLHNRMTSDGEQPDYQVIDVIILNMLYCGYMTEEHFMAVNQGTLQPKGGDAGVPNPFSDTKLPVKN